MLLKNEADKLNILCQKIKKLSENQIAKRAQGVMGATGATGATGALDLDPLTDFVPQFFLGRDAGPISITPGVPLGPPLILDDWLVPGGFFYLTGTSVSFNLMTGFATILDTGFYSIKIVFTTATPTYNGGVPTDPIILANLIVDGSTIMTTPIYSLLDPGGNISAFTTTMILDAMLTSGSMLNIEFQAGGTVVGMEVFLPINVFWSMHRIG